MTARSTDGEKLLTPAEVAALFRVDPKTVTRWAKAGKLTSIRTLGGHRRYRAAEVYSLLDQFAPGSAPQQRPVPPTGVVPRQAPPPRPGYRPAGAAQPQPRTIALPNSRVDTRH